MNVSSSAVTISPILVLTYVLIVFVKEQMESYNHWNSNVVMVTTLRLTTSALIVIIETRGGAGSRGWSPWLLFSFLKTVTVPVAIYDSFLPCPFL